MSVPTQACSFSAFKIYPGHGRTHIRPDGKIIHFITAKSHAAFTQESKPHKIRWTLFYRKKHNKTKIKSENRNKTRKTQKFVRPILGMGLADILAKTQRRTQIREAANAKAAAIANERKKTREAQRAKNPSVKQTTKPVITSKAPVRAPVKRKVR